MLILRPYEPKIFVPMPSWQWREPSRALERDQLGNTDQVRFRVRARLADGHIRWTGWFDSYDDFDAFANSIAHSEAYDIPVPREDWNLPSPNWHPDIGEGAFYEFATLEFLTSNAGTNTTYTSLAAWNNSNNTIELIAGGGHGVASSSTSNHSGGGGGGGYAGLTNFVFATPGTTTATRRVGPAVGDSWFNGTTLAGSSLSAVHGSSGSSGTGGAAGTGTTGAGITAHDGGRGGNGTGAQGNAAGGGGAAGSSGNGAQGVDTAASGNSNGGAADNGVGGAAGLGSSSIGGGGLGGDGTEWDATHGSGGGGGSHFRSSSAATGGDGGNYGGGGGAAEGTSATRGDGIQGIIVLTNYPAAAFPFTRQPDVNSNQTTMMR